MISVSTFNLFVLTNVRNTMVSKWYNDMNDGKEEYLGAEESVNESTPF